MVIVVVEGKKIQCTECNFSALSIDDPIFDNCKPNNHELLSFNDPDHMQKESIRGKIISKVKGFVGDHYVESVLVNGKPKFLAKHLETKEITLKDLIEMEDRKLRPLEKDEVGYIPYSFEAEEVQELSSRTITREDILSDVKEQIDRYIVTKELDRHLILGHIILTYSLEWVSTIGFPFFVGETESGKSSVLHLAKWLCYRCLYGEDIPNADIYNFLGSDEEATGTICEDEAQELYRDREKIRTYKNSYSKGSSKPRMLMLSNKKTQIYYKTFCPKWFAGEKIPQDKGFMERLAIVHMMDGVPKSNIKRITQQERDSLHKLRNKLLIWKLQNIEEEQETVPTNLKGRDEELWQDFVNVANCTSFQEKFGNVIKFYIDQRHEAIRNSLEAKLFKMLTEKINSKLELNFVDYWEHITNTPDLPGSISDKSRKTFYPDDYVNTITHNSLAKILEYKFHGIKIKTSSMDKNKARHQITLYKFPKEQLESMARKYGTELTIDSPIQSGLSGQSGQQDNDVDDVDDLT